MKKLLLLFVAGCLLNCTNTKDETNKPKEENTADKPEKTKDLKKPGKDLLDKHFEKAENEELTKEDNSGWPEDRKNEVLGMCKEDVGDDGKEAMAYCNCQLDNAMKIFASYKEAMTIFNKAEEERTPAERKKMQMMSETDESCWNQNRPKDEEDEDGKEYNRRNDDQY
jgi:hypothetical protein